MDQWFPRPPGPPATASCFRSDDLDEVRAFVRGRDGEHTRVVHKIGPLRYETAALRGTTVSVGWGRTAVDKTIRGAAQPHLLHLWVPDGSRYRFGREELVAGARSVTFVPGGWEFSRRSQAGEFFGLTVHDRRLVDEIAARRPTSRGQAVLLARVLELDDAARVRLFDAAATAVGSAAADGVPSPHAEARLVALLANVLLAGSAVEYAPALAASRLAAVEAWIDAHLEQPITVGSLCAVAGVGERALQKAFESRRGLSPMRFVAERRLAAARRLLESASPHDGVTEVATRLGFHLGRFAGLYRGVFGEAPSQTLARARR